MYKRSRSRSWKRKQRRRPWYVYLLWIIGIPIGLELLARLIFSATGLNQSFTDQVSDQTKRVQSYQLGFRSPDGQPYQLPNQGKLQAVRNPLMGYQLLPQQKSDYWTINPQGFRDSDPIPVEKAPNEVRIFVLGGAMAFGQLSSSNQTTLAHQLETMLNQRVTEQQANPNQFQPASLPYTADEVAKVLQRPARIAERRYRVVNAAVPGYATGNDLAMLVQQVAAYSPDIVILLDSYEDLLLPSTYSGADVPGLDQLIAGKHQSVGETMKAQASKTVQNWFNQLYLVQGVQHLILKAPKSEETKTLPLNLPVNGSVAQSLAGNDTELDARISRYQTNLVQIIRWSAAARKRLLIGIQPELSSRATNQMPASEQAMLNDLGDNYSQRMQASYSKLVAAAKQATQSTSGGATVKLLDLHQLYASSKELAFQSPTSLTDDGYKQLAEQFYQAISAQLTVEPKPYGGG